MALFTYIYHCCCKHEKEPEKLPNHSIVEQPKTRNEDKLLFLPDESSIIAAPSPHMDDHSDCPKLQIKIIESSAIETGTVVNIGPLGLEGSKRGKMDGKVFFGSKLRDGAEVVNDFVVDELMKGFGGRHFLIKYLINKQKYSISDLGDGSGTFVKIDSPIVLKDGYIVSYGNSHMTIHYNSDM
jgi:pSer/pThr/pTyr-binding forkhead associated (FHA) protein